MSESSRMFTHKHFDSKQLSVIPENIGNEGDPIKEIDIFNDSFIFELSTMDDYCHDATIIANMLDVYNDDNISINHIEELLSIVPFEHRKNMGYFLLDCAKQNMKPSFKKSYLIQCILNASASNKFQIVQIMKSLHKWKKPTKLISSKNYYRKSPIPKPPTARNAVTDHNKKYSTMPLRSVTPFSHSVKDKTKISKELAMILEGRCNNARISFPKHLKQ